MATQDDRSAGTQESGPDAAAAPTTADTADTADTAGHQTAPAPSAPQPAHAAAPATGDPAIDAALAELEAVAGEPLAQHIAAGERVHQVLQNRLSDLGGA